MNDSNESPTKSQTVPGRLPTTILRYRGSSATILRDRGSSATILCVGSGKQPANPRRTILKSDVSNMLASAQEI